jgi:rhamnose utilization protein RhaD (predicted bifunctional aldolase and dehydrogenase)
VTQCPPGEARAKPIKVVDKAERWLERHSDDVKDPRAGRRQMRMALAQRERIARRNAAITRGPMTVPTMRYYADKNLHEAA